MTIRTRKELQGIGGYSQGRSAGPSWFKLSSNENPNEPFPEVLEAVQKHTAGFNRYPKPVSAELVEKIAARYQLPASRILLGAGSTPLLYQAVAATAGVGDEVMFAWRSFEAYPLLALPTGATNVRIPLTEDGRHDLIAMAAAITERTRIIILCSPNNPTGPVITTAEFTEFMAKVPEDILVVLDEAYVEYVTDPEAVNGLVEWAKYPNLMLLRTFSKAWGLAGLRVGWALAPEEMVGAMRLVGIPMSIPNGSAAGAIAVLDFEERVFERVRETIESRELLVQGLRDLGIRVPNSESNFVWIPTKEAQSAFDYYFDHELILRAFPPEGIRITVGERASVAKLLETSRELVEKLLTN